jgi:hypothetical protein
MGEWNDYQKIQNGGELNHGQGEQQEPLTRRRPVFAARMMVRVHVRFRVSMINNPPILAHNRSGCIILVYQMN